MIMNGPWIYSSGVRETPSPVLGPTHQKLDTVDRPGWSIILFRYTPAYLLRKTRFQLLNLCIRLKGGSLILSDPLFSIKIVIKEEKNIRRNQKIHK